VEYKNKHSKIVAIHQPNYLPWPGFFYKIYASDIFIFHDNVEHSKRYPTRRTRIRKAPHSEEPCWLTVPLKKHSDFSLIKDLEIDHSQDWQGKHLRKVNNSYAGTPYFGDYFPRLEEWFAATRQFDLLAEVNIFLIKNILAWLRIEREIWRSSELPVEGKGSLYNLELVKYLGGQVYLSGKGGYNYQTVDDFSGVGLELASIDFGMALSLIPIEKPYLSNSIIASIFYFGPSRVTEILEVIKSSHAQNHST
jgi:hypothetical protein